MTVKLGTTRLGTTRLGTTTLGTVLQAGGIVPPPQIGRIFKALTGDLFISINDKFFTELD